MLHNHHIPIQKFAFYLIHTLRNKTTTKNKNTHLVAPVHTLDQQHGIAPPELLAVFYSCESPSNDPLDFERGLKTYLASENGEK